MRSTLRYRWVILALAVLSQFSASIVGQAIGPLAPLFQAELGLGKAEVGLFASAAFAGAWAMLLISGSLIDRFGVRPMISLAQTSAGLLIMLMTSAGTAVHAIAILFAAGAARSPVFPGSTKAIMEWFPPNRRGAAMGIKQTGSPLSGILTAATLPALGLAIGWRAAFAVLGIGMLAAGVATALLYRDPAGRRWGPVRPRGLGQGLGEVRRSRTLWTLGLMAILLALAQQATLVHLALYLKEVVLVEAFPGQAARIVAAGGFLALCQAGGAFGRVFWGVVSDRAFGGRRVMVIGTAAAMAAATGLAMARTGPGIPLGLLAAIVFLAGAAGGGWPGVFHTLVAEVAGPKLAATGLGLCLTMLETGTTLGPTVFGLVADVAGGYLIAWYLTVGLYLGGGVVAAAIARADKGA